MSTRSLGARLLVGGPLGLLTSSFTAFGRSGRVIQWVQPADPHRSSVISNDVHQNQTGLEKLSENIHVAESGLGMVWAQIRILVFLRFPQISPFIFVKRKERVVETRYRGEFGQKGY